MLKNAPTLSSATGRHRIGTSAAISKDLNPVDSDSRIKGDFPHLDFSPIAKAPTRQYFLRRGIEELRIHVETVVIRTGPRICAYDGLRRAVRTVSHTGGGVLDVDGVHGDSVVPYTAHADDDPGGQVFRVENVTGVKIAGCYGCDVGLGVGRAGEGVVGAVVVPELEGRTGVPISIGRTRECGRGTKG